MQSSVSYYVFFVMFITYGKKYVLFFINYPFYHFHNLNQFLVSEMFLRCIFHSKKKVTFESLIKFHLTNNLKKTFRKRPAQMLTRYDDSCISRLWAPCALILGDPCLIALFIVVTIVALSNKLNKCALRAWCKQPLRNHRNHERLT